jgi:hypothetical protein
MELYPAEVARIDKLVTDWVDHADQELEATFGLGGTVSASTFLAIAQRLALKGYVAESQDDRLSILVQDTNVRLSLQGLGILQMYCRDNKLEGKQFTAMIKDRTSEEANVDLEEYDTRIKIRREVVMANGDPRVRGILDTWDQRNKAFRLVKRWTYMGEGMRIDMSMVRSTATDRSGSYKWQRRFLEPSPMNNPVRYEVEVELLRGDATNTKEKARAVLIRGVGEILRAMQKNTLLLRKSVHQQVIQQYTALNGNSDFRGVSPITLEVRNMRSEVEEGVPNIRSDYCVTDKADGLRCLGFCNEKGELYLIDMGMRVYRTGLLAAQCANSLVDGEWVTVAKDGTAVNLFLLFDIYKASTSSGVNDVWRLPFFVSGSPTDPSRWNTLSNWATAWSEHKAIVARGLTEGSALKVSMKQFLFTDPAKSTSIYDACRRVFTLNMTEGGRRYNTDGLILTPNSKALPARAGRFDGQFKWKPAKDNTIDFLVVVDKNPANPAEDFVQTTIDPRSGVETRYKTLRLYIGAWKDPYDSDPRNAVLQMMPLPAIRRAKGEKRPPYQAVRFAPIEFPDTMASTCYVSTKLDESTGQEHIVTADSDEPLYTKTIIEMRYVPTNPPGWRWVPMRVRHDKTERYEKGRLLQTLNGERAANGVWNSIHDPVTISMITTGAEEPTVEELMEIRSDMAEGISVGRKYFERKAPKEDMAAVRGLRDFHNHYIKDSILYRATLKGGGKSLLDLAVGQAGDLHRWTRMKAGYVLGVDIASDNITNVVRGAYRRYLNAQIEAGSKDAIPDMTFVIGDASKPLRSGDAGTTPEEQDMLRVVFGGGAKGAVPKAVTERAAGKLAEGADVATCMFALHYFFESSEKLEGLLYNLSTCVKEGGYFAGCCFDGAKVYGLLNSTKTGHSLVGTEADGTPIWSIRKVYDDTTLQESEASIGMAIDVNFISIGTEHREYLVYFPYLVKRLKEIGFELLTPEEYHTLGLNASTNLFEKSHEMAQKSKHNYVMSDPVQRFSFLNRWFVFKKRPITIEEAGGVVAEATEALMARAREIQPAAGAGAGAGASAGAGAGAPLPRVTGGGAGAGTDGMILAPVIFSAKSSEENLRWLAPTSLFVVKDKEDVAYPSIEHYLAGMRLKHASNDKARGTLFAATVMSTTGSIHQKYLAERTALGTFITPDQEKELTDKEFREVKALKGVPSRGAAAIKVDEEVWKRMQPEFLEEALQQRWTKDRRFRETVEESRAKGAGAYLLYEQSATSSLGGTYNKARKVVSGGNLLGKTIMHIAKFPGA